MMKKVICCALIIFNILSFTGKVYGAEDDYDITMKRDLLILTIAYPGYIVDFEKNDSGNIFVIMKSGQKYIYDDKRRKTFEEKFSNPDIQDVMEQIYPLGSIDKVMDKNIDPGRIRHYGILNEVYGRNRGEIEKNLKSTTEGVAFNNKNGALEQLNKAFKGARELCKREGKAAACFYPINGTYNYRVISGTGMLSPHAYAIAIDLNRNNKDYWKWATLEQGNERIREYSDVPIIMLSAKGEDMDKIMGLEYGADDYITKPYNILEVKARIKAVLRRRTANSKAEEASNEIVYGLLRLNLDSRTLYIDGRDADLTVIEFNLLEAMAKHPNKVFSRQDLLKIVRGEVDKADARSIDVHIRRLREKIEENPSSPKYVHTKWGVGYYFHA